LRDKPQFLLNDDFQEKLYREIEQYDDEYPETYNIVQITDWHVDINYLEGSKKKCGWEICCQLEWGMAETKEEAARKYGEVTCDIPFITAI
jgi:hypothetical protein